MEKKKWSKYQEAIFEFIKDGKGSLVVNAVAGSGKTTTIVECAQIARKNKLSVLFLAFNKSIATELGQRMDGTGVECKTLHSHGYRAIMRKLGRSVVLNYDKWKNYIDDNADTFLECQEFDSDAERASYVRDILKLLNLARINLIEKVDDEELEDLNELAEHHGIDVDDNQISIVNDILGICYRTDEEIDFTDMITLPVVCDKIRKALPKYDIVFVDEAQDLSKAQRELVLASLEKGGRFVAVGDKKQAINGFAGADVVSFNTLAEIAGNELPLSVCYRCGKTIVEEAQGIVPYIQYFENAQDGLVRHAKDLTSVEIGDMILCRKTAPLIGVCLRLIANGTPALVKGRDIADGLKSMISRSKAKTISALENKLQKEIDKVERKVIKKGYDGTLEEQPAVIAIRDKVDCIMMIADNCTSVDEVMERVERLFSDTQDGRVVTLSTVHKAKGLEADNAFIICPNILPMRRKQQQEWELEQEMNLKYVAITRAKKCLTYVDVDEDKLPKVALPKA